MKIVIATDRNQPNDRYRGALFCAGALPEEVAAVLPGQKLPDDFDGLLLAGGPDVAPERYGESPATGTLEVDAARDALDFALLAAAAARKIPVFGICRGIQVLNVALGGTLWQDLGTQRSRGVVHDGDRDAGIFPDHLVRMRPSGGGGSAFAAALAAPGGTTVNTRHHQGIKDLAPGLAPLAASPDDLVEAVEKPDEPFLAAVQWHPEDLVARPDQKRLFGAFLDACRARVRRTGRRPPALIEVALTGRVPVVRFNRPAARNAFTAPMAAMLADTVEALGKDTSVPAIVLSGNGSAFSAGGDLDVMRALAAAADAEGFRELLEAGGRAVLAMYDAPRPVLAAVDGAAAGGGLSLALAADVRVASAAAGHAALFVPSYAALGLIPAWGATLHLPERLGAGSAADVIFSAERFGAVRARQAGLVDVLVEDGPSLPAALARAETYAERSLPAVAASKRLLASERRPRLVAALEREVESQIELFRSGEILRRLPGLERSRPDEQETS
jgi:putative glutamine amidotransferase